MTTTETKGKMKSNPASTTGETRETRVEYDMAEIDERLICDIRSQAAICRAYGIRVEGVFHTKNHLLDLETAEKYATQLIKSGIELRKMIQASKSPLR